MSNGLEVISATKRFGKKEILKNVSFHLAQGEILGLFGKNGCGKSTLLKVLFGTLKADTIELTLDGKPLSPKKVIPEQLVGYLPQENFLLKHIKVRDVIPLFYQDGDEQDKIFRAPFIEQIARQKVGTLSMGQLRYLELLLVANGPHPFLMLDEPFSMIEPLYKEKISAFLLSLTEGSSTHSTIKKGILLTDHYYSDVLTISNNNLVLVDGIVHPIRDSEDLKDFGYLK